MDKKAENILKVNEIFYSIQGESTYAGLPCVFIRLTYCNLRCAYCDTEYAFYEGEDLTFDQILDRVKQFGCNLVEVTGGEPLVQKNALFLMTLLCDAGYEVLLETGGHIDISRVDARVKRIMDIKCPSGGEADKTLFSNIEHLRNSDQVKFVIGDRRDFDYAAEIVRKYRLTEKCPVLFSPVFGKLENKTLAEWILDERLPVRMQIQLQKYIWDAQRRGV
ncbi:MAG: radical SAM protein [Calditrichaeota bacterium]|nr:radical SAM protein [Calditrichota bacterium]